MKRWISILCLLVFATNCGDSALETDAADTSAPTEAPSATGTYETQGTWDLSGPLAGSQTVGDLVAELLIDKLVGMASLPFGIGEDMVKEKLSGLIRKPVSDFVNANQPATLAEGGQIHETLSVTLASVQVDTILTLTEDADSDLSGSETITKIQVPYDGNTVEVPLDGVVDDGEMLASLSASITGQRTAGDTVSLDDHAFQLRLNKLIEKILTDVVGIDLDAINDALDCDNLLTAVMGEDGGMTIDLPLGQSVTIGKDLANDACEAIKEKVAAKLIDVVSPDTGVIVGGSINGVDTTADGMMDALQSNADYDGAYTSLPGPVDPVILITFTGARVDDTPAVE